MTAVRLPTEPGITPPKNLELERQPLLKKWLQILYLSFPKTRTVKATLDPASVAANSESLQTFTIEGLSLNDLVIVNKPSNTANIWIVQAYVSAADTLAIKFYNNSGGAIDPASEDYLIKATRI